MGPRSRQRSPEQALPQSDAGSHANAVDGKWLRPHESGSRPVRAKAPARRQTRVFRSRAQGVGLRTSAPPAATRPVSGLLGVRLSLVRETAATFSDGAKNDQRGCASVADVKRDERLSVPQGAAVPKRRSRCLKSSPDRAASWGRRGGAPTSANRTACRAPIPTSTGVLPRPLSRWTARWTVRWTVLSAN